MTRLTFRSDESPALLELLGKHKELKAVMEAGGETRALRLVRVRGEAFSMLKRSRRYCRPLYWPDGALLHVTLPAPRLTPAQTYAENVRKWAAYVLKWTPADCWPELRRDAKAATPDTLAAFAALDLPGGYEAWEVAPDHGLPRIERHRPTTVATQGAAQWTRNAIASHFALREDFSRHWRSSYDCTASGRRCPDGVYRAWLSAEYKDCGNGHYYLLLDGFHAIFAEDD